MGGSQGSHFLNEKFVEALSMLDKDTKAVLQVAHITGAKDYDWAIGKYKDIVIEHRVFSFIDRIEDLYSASDLVITRSGASAIFELALFGKPMVLVPYPYALSHQVANAKAFSGKGAAIEIDEKSLSADVFKDKILKLFNNKDILNNLARSAKALSVPGSADNLANVVFALGKEKRCC